MKCHWPLLALLLLLAPGLSAQSHAQAAPPAVESAYGTKMQIAGIHNAGKITDGLYRGAQPREESLSELKKLGVSTIVDLRSEDREKIARERKLAASLGMRFVHIPVGGWSTPTDEQLVQFLALFRREQPQKIFVHCHYGDDRTGVFVASYRIAVEKWSAEQAVKEMYFFGFRGFWHPAMKSFIRDFPSRWNSAPAFAHLHAATSQP